MVPSEEIPNAILKINMVEGFKCISKNPISPAVIISGTRLGITDISTIRGDINNVNITIAINIMASKTDSNRFSTRKALPFRNIKLFPVITTL